MNVQKAINRRAWKHIKQLRNAKNFLCVESIISNARLDTFKTRDSAVYKILQREAGVPEDQIQAVVSRRNDLSKKHRDEFAALMDRHIPERLKVVRLYQEFKIRYSIQ